MIKDLRGIVYDYKCKLFEDIYIEDRATAVASLCGLDTYGLSCLNDKLTDIVAKLQKLDNFIEKQEQLAAKISLLQTQGQVVNATDLRALAALEEMILVYIFCE